MTRTDSELGKLLGKSIAKHRHRANLTQAQGAERLGISDEAISRMERGGIMPTVTRLIQLAELFDCKASDFLQETSPLLNDQTQRIFHLLAQLDTTERQSLLDVIEAMINWHLTNKSSSTEN